MRRRARVLAATSRPLIPLYAALARLAGRALRDGATPTLALDVPAVFVAPHPDDEIAAAGTLALHVRAGARVTVVVCTDGSASRAVPGPVSERGGIRRSECEAAQRTLGTDLVWLGATETLDLDVAALAARLAPLLAGARVVYAPSRIDFHPGHLAVAEAVARAVPEGAEVRVYGTSVPLVRFADHVVDVGGVESVVRAATAAYTTQERTLWAIARQRRYVAAFHGVDHVAEAFRALPAARYRELHADPWATWPDVFRGLRPHALTDPLAWTVGRDERATLRAATASTPRTR